MNKVKIFFFVLAFPGAILVDVVSYSLFPIFGQPRDEPKVQLVSSRERTVSTLQEFSKYNTSTLPLNYKRYPETLPKDAWGHELRYEESSDGKNFTVTSTGDDGTVGTEDDLVYVSSIGTVKYKASPKDYLKEAYFQRLSLLLVVIFLVHLVFVIPYGIYHGSASYGYVALLAACYLAWPHAVITYLASLNKRHRKSYTAAYFAAYPLVFGLFYFLIKK